MKNSSASICNLITIAISSLSIDICLRRLLARRTAGFSLMSCRSKMCLGRRLEVVFKAGSRRVWRFILRRSSRQWLWRSWRSQSRKKSYDRRGRRRRKTFTSSSGPVAKKIKEKSSKAKTVQLKALWWAIDKAQPKTQSPSNLLKTYSCAWRWSGKFGTG